MGTWYRTGTVSVINGSPDIVGVGTLWLSQASVGDIFLAPNLVEHEITSITDDTHLSVKQVNGTAAYAGTTASAQNYAIIRNFTSTLPAQLASQLAALMTTYHVTLDELTAWLSGVGAVTVHDSVGNSYSVQTPAAMNAILTGRLVKSVAGAGNITLTSAEAANLFHELTGTRTAVGNYIIPASARHYFVFNNTAYAMTVKTAAGTGVSVSSGARMLVECDGTNVFDAISEINASGGALNNVTVGLASPLPAKFTRINALSSQVTGNDIDATAGSAIECFVSANIGYMNAIDRAAASTYRELRYGAASHRMNTPGGTHLEIINTNNNINGTYNAAATAVGIYKDGVTGRSINTPGSINASGADYAEYEFKSATCGLIVAGQIIGFDSSGKVTDKFSKSISFGIKSTNPNLVGGDTWGTEISLGMAKPAHPVAPAVVAPADAAYHQYQIDLAAYTAAETKYLADMTVFNTALEAARLAVDRVAYCGKVPVNVTGALPGDYIIPVAGTADAIIGSVVNSASLTFAQSMIAVGRVRRVLADGRAEVAVMVH